MGVGREGQGWALASLDFETISKKRLFFQFRGVKNKFYRFWLPPGKNFGKIPYWPPWKKSFRRPLHVARAGDLFGSRCFLGIFKYCN